MASLESLPADQRAVLQLVLQRGRSYDDIARLLSIDRTAVRQRALSALDTLGPQTGVGDEPRALITDYLLGQLPDRVRDQVRARLSQSPAERAWARVLTSELAPLSAGPLPEIPTEVPDDGHWGTEAAPWDEPPAAEPDLAEPPEDEPLVVPARWSDEPASAAASAPVAATVPAEPVRPPARPGPAPTAAGDGTPPADRPPRTRRTARSPSSRRGGLILIALVAILIALVVVLLSGGSNPKKRSTAGAATSHSTPAPPSSTTSSTTTSGTTTSGSSTAAHVIAQINLTPPAGSKAAGIAEVLKEGATDGIAIVAQNVAPNTTKPPNAYAVWLYNSPTDAHLLGFVNPGVGANGRLQTAGGLPANAVHYKNLIVTVETAASPKVPGTIILQGPLTGL